MTMILDGTKGVGLPTWNTAGRPTGISTGYTGYNTTTAQIEVYNATYNTWNTAGTPGNTYSVEYLVVAGGGSGGYGGPGGAGGGGAGGMLTGTSTLTSGVTYTATVGGGGANPSAGANGIQGSNSTFSGSNLKAPQPQGGARKRSFCARMSGMPGPMKDEKGRPTRKAASLKRWKCN